MRIKPFPLIGSLIVAALGVAASSGCKVGSAQQRLAGDVSAALHRLDDKGAFLTARVVDLQTGQVLLSENPDEPMIPASNGKLAISAAALDLFGPNHTFKTYLVLNGDDLWIVGSGDPATGDEKIAQKYGREVTSVFDDWADAVRRRGLSRVSGNIYYCDRAFDEQWVHPLWKKSFLVDWYAAPVSGLNFNDNCIDVTAYPGDAPGTPARLEVVPPNTVATIENQTTTGGDSRAEITRAADAPRFTVAGGVSRKQKYESKPITDPGAFFADAFRVHLQTRGIEVAGQVFRADELPFPPTGPGIDRILAVHETAMPDILNRINKNSQNLFAEAISKAMGREYAFRRDGASVPGSWALGEEATKAFLTKYGISAGQFVAADGSGLARENRVTSRLITDLLELMWRHPHGKMWRDSLSVGGVDGTIGKRQKDFAGRVYAKTGYIGGVRSLSGYARTFDDRWLAFSFIYNNIEGSVKPYEALQDDACWALVHYPRKAPPRRTTGEALPATAPTTAPTAIEPATQPSSDVAAPAPDAPSAVDDASTQPTP